MLTPLSTRKVHLPYVAGGCALPLGALRRECPAQVVQRPSTYATELIELGLVETERRQRRASARREEVFRCLGDVGKILAVQVRHDVLPAGLVHVGRDR